MRRSVWLFSFPLAIAVGGVVLSIFLTRAFLDWNEEHYQWRRIYTELVYFLSLPFALGLVGRFRGSMTTFLLASGGAAIATAVVSLPPRPRVVISFVRGSTPWKPASTITLFVVRASSTRIGLISMMRAFECEPSVMTPAWLPVKLIEGHSRSWRAIEKSAIETRSPVVSIISSSRRFGFGLTL